MSKKRYPRTGDAVTEARQNQTQEQYSTDFTEKQAERIFRRDTRLLYIGALVILMCYTLARLGGWIA